MWCIELRMIRMTIKPTKLTSACYVWDVFRHVLFHVHPRSISKEVLSGTLGNLITLQARLNQIDPVVHATKGREGNRANIKLHEPREARQESSTNPWVISWKPQETYGSCHNELGKGRQPSGSCHGLQGHSSLKWVSGDVLGSKGGACDVHHFTLWVSTGL